MTTPLSQMPKPTVEQFEGRKKLFLIPNHVLPPNAPEDGLELLSRYWSEVRDSIANLERSLGPVSRIYHELIYTGGDDGLRQIEMMNPSGGPFIRAMCQSTAALHPLEDADLVLENTDWQRVLSIGPASQKVLTAALDGYQSTLEARYTAIAERISSDLAEGECAALFIREDHRVQFSTDVQVFYVAPPALDTFKRWLEDYFTGGATSDTD